MTKAKDQVADEVEDAEAPETSSAPTIVAAASGDPDDNAGLRGPFEHNGVVEDKAMPGTNIKTQVLVAPERAGDEGVLVEKDVYRTERLRGSKTATTQVLVHKAGTRLYGDEAAAYAAPEKETKAKKK